MAFFSFCATVVLILILSPLSTRLRLTDHPSDRKHHTTPTPLTGGIAMAGAVVLSLAITDLQIQSLGPFIACSLALVAFGAVDDANELDYRVRLLVQALAAAILVYWGGLRIDTLGNLFGFGDIDLGPFAIPFTVFAVVGMINAINMLDGIDGLAGTACLGILFPVTLFSGFLGAADIMLVGILLAMSILGFLVFNYRFPWRTKAHVFMGDAGSNFLGFSLAWLTLLLVESEAMQLPPIAILWVVGYPVIDTIGTMHRRRKKGVSPFLPGHDHVHFLLQRVGFGTNAVVLIISGISAVLASAAFVAQLEGIPEPILTLGFVALFIGNHYLLSHAARITKSFRHLLTKADSTDEQPH